MVSFISLNIKYLASGEMPEPSSHCPTIIIITLPYHHHHHHNHLHHHNHHYHTAPTTFIITLP